MLALFLYVGAVFGGAPRRVVPGCVLAPDVRALDVLKLEKKKKKKKVEVDRIDR
jgi:hypothetical protein